MRVDIKEFTLIVIFLIMYGIGANIQSRINPVPGSLAAKTRTSAMLRLAGINEEIKMNMERNYCENMALSMSHEHAIVWYHNNATNEYWCGHVELDRLTSKRANELKPHITVLNSTRNIESLRRLKDESDNYNR